MATTNQLINNIRTKKKRRQKKPALEQCPQKKGICLKILYVSPKKPNSAVRKVARLVLTTRRIMLAYIPGENHNLNQYASVLIRGGRVRDLPGIYYKIIRGVLGLTYVPGRTNARSKYGVKFHKGVHKMTPYKKWRT